VLGLGPPSGLGPRPGLRGVVAFRGCEAGTQKVSVAWGVVWGVPDAPETLLHPARPHLHGQAGAQVHSEDGHGLPPVVDGEDEVLSLFVLIQDSQECCGQAGQGRKESGVTKGPGWLTHLSKPWTLERQGATVNGSWLPPPDPAPSEHPGYDTAPGAEQQQEQVSPKPRCRWASLWGTRVASKAESSMCSHVLSSPGTQARGSHLRGCASSLPGAKGGNLLTAPSCL
uniref:Uncharacterized protein n=1 Tax=Equus asinus TaxID=9793 RepID=A0A9L0JY73_EQUAS